MKMVKSLLLGSAAGLVAVAGAQAADLPVKAKPVEYVKICSLYGDGFYYIPGSQTCLKLSGYIRADYGYNVDTNVVHVYGTNGAQDRSRVAGDGSAPSRDACVHDPASRQFELRYPHADGLWHAAYLRQPALRERSE